MKRLGVLLLTCISAVGQVPGTVKVINFSRADREHCRLVRIEGRPMRESMYGGLSAAVGDPVSTKDGYFRVFVLVRQIGPGKTEVKPKEFFALDSDTAHTRFSFYDKAAEVMERRTEDVAELHDASGTELPNSPKRAGNSGSNASIGSSKAAKLGRLRKPDPNEVDGEFGGTEERDAAEEGTAVTPAELYLSRSTLRQGDWTEGFVYFRKPKKSRLNTGAEDRLSEVDVPVHGVVFRFSQ